jgi:hypothetical protein
MKKRCTWRGTDSEDPDGMNERDNSAEEAAAQHVVAVVGGEYKLHDTGTEPGQYDVDITTGDGVSVALEATSFGGADWRRTAARVQAAGERGSFTGGGLERHWWVVFRSGADLRAMEQPLTQVLRQLEREGRNTATRRYQGDDPSPVRPRRTGRRGRSFGRR